MHPKELDSEGGVTGGHNVAPVTLRLTMPSSRSQAETHTWQDSICVKILASASSSTARKQTNSYLGWSGVEGAGRGGQGLARQPGELLGRRCVHILNVLLFTRMCTYIKIYQIMHF